MITPFFEFLADKELPGFALLKNTRIQSVARLGNRISQFDEAHWATSYQELCVMLPIPHLLETREAREQAAYKFSEEDLKTGHFQFDDMPIALTNESSDRELFGECYTIFWVVSTDKQNILEHLLNDLQTPEGEKISSEMIKKLWDEKVNRIFFHYTGDVDAVEHALLQEELHEELIEAINALPNAPEESSWEVLNEDVFWGDDEES